MYRHITAIVLAAGRSSRMGYLKGLLPWKGMTLLEYQLNQLKRTRVKKVIVVLGHGAELFRPLIKNMTAEILVNSDYDSGKSSSIRLAVSRMAKETDGVLIMAVDQPVPSNVLNKLISSFNEQKSLITVPVYQGRKGHPVLFSARLRDDLQSIEENTEGLRKVMRKYKDKVFKAEADHPEVLLNLNSQEAYRKAFENYGY